jgi:hypothetical protein
MIREIKSLLEKVFCPISMEKVMIGYKLEYIIEYNRYE